MPECRKPGQSSLKKARGGQSSGLDDKLPDTVCSVKRSEVTSVGSKHIPKGLIGPSSCVLVPELQIRVLLF